LTVSITYTKMYYMKYTTTITSKGTITIAAPLRKALGFKAGQKVSLSLDKNQQVTISGGTSVADFEKLRSEITKKIPSHKKGLTGQALKDATAKAWVADYRE
jgi:AbrB family looped-hinge helix DNA binding protein